MTTSRRRQLALPLVLAAAWTPFMAQGAYAYYQQSVAASSAPATVNVAAPQAVTLTATGTVTEKLHPGGPARPVTVTVSNTWGRTLTVKGITGTAASAGACSPDITVAAPVGSPAQLPYNVTGTSDTRTLTGFVKMGTAATAACMGETINITFTVTGEV